MNILLYIEKTELAKNLVEIKVSGIIFKTNHVN